MRVSSFKYIYQTFCYQTSYEKGVFSYECPFCNKLVKRNVRTGQVDHRNFCENRLSVKDGVLAEKSFSDGCKVVGSNVRTGQVDHRSLVGKKFAAKDGVVRAAEMQP